MNHCQICCWHSSGCIFRHPKTCLFTLATVLVKLKRRHQGDFRICICMCIYCGLKYWSKWSKIDKVNRLGDVLFINICYQPLLHIDMSSDPSWPRWRCYRFESLVILYYHLICKLFLLWEGCWMAWTWGSVGRHSGFFSPVVLSIPASTEHMKCYTYFDSVSTVNQKYDNGVQLYIRCSELLIYC